MNTLPAPQPSFTEMERLAERVAKSRLFGIQTTDQAMTLMSISQAEGRHPALAARDYDIIQGRPAKKAEAMLRDFLESGGKVQWHALTDDIADATFSHPSGGTIRLSWDHARCEKAGLLSKDMHRKYPRQMLRSRCVSEGVRTVCPMATSGMLVPEETAEIGPARQVLDALPEPAPPLSDDLDSFASDTAEPELFIQARAAAEGGTESFRAWYKTQREHWPELKPRLSEYQAIAAGYDHPRERDADFWSGDRLAISAKDGRAFEALMHRRLREARTPGECEALESDNPQIEELSESRRSDIAAAIRARRAELSQRQEVLVSSG